MVHFLCSQCFKDQEDHTISMKEFFDLKNKNLCHNWTKSQVDRWDHPALYLDLFLFDYYLSLSMIYRLIGLVGRIFDNGSGDLGSIPGRVIPKTFKMVPDTSLLNNQQYKVRIKGKVEQSRKMCSALPYTYWKRSLLVALDHSRQIYWSTIHSTTKRTWKLLWRTFLTRGRRIINTTGSKNW